MDEPLRTSVVVLAAFLAGGIPFGWCTARWVAGIDIRDHGSRNIGATNVGRVVGRGWGVLVLLLDVAKGVLAAGWPAAAGDPVLAAWSGMAAILGHVFSPYLGFRGGKGVATAAGVFAILAPSGLAVALGTFGVVFALTRVVAVGSLAATLALFVSVLVTGAPLLVRVLTGVVTVVVFVRHAGNIRRGFRKPN
ncbi:MAG: glycerol-3-phosphate 1-O-acyltransferase PlsY [Myxococcota bacterium]